VELRASNDGEFVRTAGCVIARQRPGTAKGFIFLSMEDETGIANVIVTPNLYERERLLVTRSKFLHVQLWRKDKCMRVPLGVDICPRKTGGICEHEGNNCPVSPVQGRDGPQSCAVVIDINLCHYVLASACRNCCWVRFSSTVPGLRDYRATATEWWSSCGAFAARRMSYMRSVSLYWRERPTSLLPSMKQIESPIGIS
jgi:hypothetical protein